VRDDGDLVVAADRREHGADRRVGERGVHVGGAIGGGRVEPPGGRVFDGNEPGRRGQPAHRLLVHLRPGDGRGERGRQDGDPVSR
jgi:hypothetical protein